MVYARDALSMAKALTSLRVEFEWDLVETALPEVPEHGNFGARNSGWAEFSSPPVSASHRHEANPTTMHCFIKLGPYVSEA